MKKKIHIKEHFDGDSTIDLSIQGIQDVPVKEIASIPKATILDLSNNQITTIPPTFPTSLAHLVRLDLSQNGITELPENFGRLVHLKYLDLYMNKLETLPLSFCYLKNLRFLDLKENPINPVMAKVIGQCQDMSACQIAAKNAVLFLENLNAQAEENRRNEELKKKMEEKELQYAIQKKENKKKKKKKNNSKHVEQVKESYLLTNGKTLNDENKRVTDSESILVKPKKKTKFFSMALSFIRSVVNFVLLSVLLMGFSLFVLSLVDEEKYKSVSSVLHKNLKHITVKIPKTYRTNFYNSYILLQDASKSAVSSIRVNLAYAGKFMVDSYTFLTTDPKVRLYLDTTYQYIHIGYIKSTEMLSIMYSKLLKAIDSYTNTNTK